MENRKVVKIAAKILASVLLIVAVLGVSLHFPSVPYTASENNGKIQQQLTAKLAQVAGVWASVKIVSGIISVVQTIQVEGSIPVVGGLAVSAQPLGWTAVVDNTLDQISNILLWAMGAIAIEKMLLAISVWVSFRIVIPVCAVFVIIAIWNRRYKQQLVKIIASIIIIGFGICSAIPLSLGLSNVIETSILSDQIEKTINEIDGQSQEIETEGNTINDSSFLDQLKRLGSGIAGFFAAMKHKIDSFIENAINYIMCFLVTNLIIPIGTILGLKYLLGGTLKLLTGFTVNANSGPLHPKKQSVPV
jgi:hypothetical protein